MPSSFTIQEKDSYLYIEVTGSRTPRREISEMGEVWRQVSVISREKGINKILAVINLSGRIPAIQSLNGVEDAETIGLSRFMKIAVVDLNDESRQDNLFTETVAVNRGFNIKIFDNKNDAEKWLLA